MNRSAMVSNFSCTNILSSSICPTNTLSLVSKSSILLFSQLPPQLR